MYVHAMWLFVTLIMAPDSPAGVTQES